MNNHNGTVTAVGLGPGDAELLTLKGLKALQKADTVFYPASSVQHNAVTSFALPILQQLGLTAKLAPLHIPMKSQERGRYYQQAFDLIKNEYDQGLNVVVVSEGDILFYSTFGYLLKLMNDAGIRCGLIPGIPAFVASSSLGNMPLVEGNNPLMVLPCPESFEEILANLKPNCTLVVMKMSKLNGWHTFLKTIKQPFLYVERVGLDTQFVCRTADGLEDRKIPYFSLLIIYS